MEILTKVMQIENNMAIISKYEVMEAFFRTEEENDSDMADELNKIINKFYEQEHQTRRNITSMPFDLNEYNQVISYIKQACV